MTIGYPLYRLSSLIASARLLSVCRYYNQLSYVLRSVCHHYNRLSTLLRDSNGIISERDRATIRSAMSCDTTTDYLLCFSAPSLIVNALKLHVLY
jgi:hypothetical protein